MMEYTIAAVKNGEVFNVTATITDGETEVLTGKTSVCCETEEKAREYAEMVFLPDLKVNFKMLAELQLTEVVADDPSINIEG